jgi:hypothetical protein
MRNLSCSTQGSNIIVNVFRIASGNADRIDAGVVFEKKY